MLNNKSYTASNPASTFTTAAAPASALDWPIERKCEAFDRIAECFYQRNFGGRSKADFEVLMFDILLQNSDAAQCTDYALAKRLGITESRVRGLKVKRELQYPSDSGDAWKRVFCESLPHMKYDPTTALVKVPITDPNVRRELENVIDDMHLISEYQLNPKLLQMRADQLIELLITIGEAEEFDLPTRQKIVSDLRKTSASELLETNDVFARFQNEGWHCLKGVGKDVAAKVLPCIAQSVLKAVDPSGIIASVLKCIL